VECCESGERYPYIVVNQDHVLFIEELAAAESDAAPVIRSGIAVVG